MLPSGGQYRLHVAAAGAVEAVTVPGGGRHSWAVQTEFGQVRLTYNWPGSQRPYTLLLNDRMQVRRTRYLAVRVDEAGGPTGSRYCGGGRGLLIMKCMGS